MNAHDLIKEAIAEKGKFDSVYWIACGGSMIDLIPAHELLQREATTFTSYIYTAREFDIMRPRRLGEKSLVIACSHSGNTPEVVEGCEIALAAGATVIAQTDNAGSKIDNGKWVTWVYPWGEGRSAGRSSCRYLAVARGRAARPAGGLRRSRRHVCRYCRNG